MLILMSIGLALYIAKVVNILIFLPKSWKECIYKTTKRLVVFDFILGLLLGHIVAATTIAGMMIMVGFTITGCLYISTIYLSRSIKTKINRCLA